jgi:hypothetical protein
MEGSYQSCSALPRPVISRIRAPRLSAGPKTRLGKLVIGDGGDRDHVELMEFGSTPNKICGSID